MQDIIIEGSNQSSNLVANVRKGRVKKPRGVVRYVFDWIIKGLFVASLLSIDFLLFAGSGNQQLFDGSFMLQPEIMAILTGLLFFSLFMMFLVSFSSFLQNVLTALIAGGFMLAILNQFAQYDKSSILVPMMTPYLGAAAASIFTGISHWVLAIGAGIFTFIILTISSKSNTAYFVGILLVILGGIITDNYITRNHDKEFVTRYDNHLGKDVPNARKYVYLFLPNATSYVTLGELRNQLGKTDKAVQTQERLIAFLAKNGFWVYPNAYVKGSDPLMNMVEDLNNIDDKKAEEHIQRNVAIDSVWNFHNVRDEYVYLKNAKLIDVYKNSKYQVSAYQSRGIEFCDKNNEINVDKCVDKVNVPVDVSSLKLSTWEKSKFLLLQWLNSFHFITDWSVVYGALDGFINAEKTPIMGISYDSFYVVNSFKTLDKVIEDIASDQGNRAYFVFMDLPSDMYVYDEFCHLKPQDQWLAMDNYKWVNNKNLFAKRAAYQDQLSCMIGKLEQFMQKLNDQKQADNTVIFLQGISGINDVTNIKTEDYIEKFKSENLLLLAIKDPAKNNFSVNNQICESRELVRNYLYKQGNCRELNRMDLQDTAAKELQKDLLKSVLTKEKVNNAMKNFDIWYQSWKKNNVEPIVFEEAPVEETTSSITQETNIDKVEPNAVEAVPLISDLPDELVEEKGTILMEAPLTEENEVEAKIINEEIQADGENTEFDGLTDEILPPDAIPVETKDSQVLPVAE